MKSVISTVIRAASKLDYKCVLVPKSKTIQERLRYFSDAVGQAEDIPNVFAVVENGGTVGLISVIGRCHNIHPEDDIVSRVSEFIVYLQKLKRRMQNIVTVSNYMSIPCIISYETSNNSVALPDVYCMILLQESGTYQMSDEALDWYDAEDDDIILIGRTDYMFSKKLISVRCSDIDVASTANLWLMSLKSASNLCNTNRCCECNSDMEVGVDVGVGVGVGVPIQQCSGCMCLVCTECVHIESSCSMCQWVDEMAGSAWMCDLSVKQPLLHQIISRRYWYYWNSDVLKGSVQGPVIPIVNLENLKARFHSDRNVKCAELD
jgi:hypothetical protein